MYQYRCCYRNNCCTPRLVSFVRGKLAITSSKRIVCWSIDGTQRKNDDDNPLVLLCKCIGLYWCIWSIWKLCMNPCLPEFIQDACRANTEYEIRAYTRVYNAVKIRQISQFFGSEARCICCCLDYAGGIELSFNEFRHHDAPASAFLKTSGTGTYIARVSDQVIY
jgi:hypothetical protein